MKKTVFIRIVTLMLSVLMLATVLVACKKEAGNEGETTAAPGGEGGNSVSTGGEGGGDGEKVLDYYAWADNQDYSGKTFTLLTYDPAAQASAGWRQYFQAHDDGAEKLNSAAVTRNNEIKEKIGVELATYLVEFASMVELIQTTTTAGMVTYDGIAFYATTGIESLMIGDYLANIKKIDTMNVQNEWYNKNANQNFTIKNKQYCVVSDFTLPVQQRFAFLANIDMIEEYGVLDQLGVETIYELVNNGDWTFENLQLMIKDVYAPSTSNVSGEYEAGDTYGFATNKNSTTRFFNNWGEDIVKLDEYGRFVFNLQGGTLEDKFAALTAFSHDNPNIWYDEFHGANGNAYYKIFQDGRAMFSTYSSDPWNLIDAKYQDGHFAYLPYPKYNSEQKDYITVTHGGLIAIPGLAVDTRFSGLMIEALSALSHKYMRGAYVDNYFHARVIQDPEGIEMYNIIINTAYYDIARYVDPSQGNQGEKLCAYLVYYEYPLRTQRSLESRYASHGAMVINGYTEFYSKLSEE